MNRKTFYWIVIGVAIVIFFFNPFDRNKPGNVYRPRNPRSVISESYDYIVNEAEAPADYVASLFKRHDVVFIGEFDRVKQQVDFVRELIPVLDAAGVKRLGIEYALYEDQELIDRLVTAASYDELLAEQILFNRLVIWGYQEYADLFRTAWEVNRNKGSGEEPFRIIGLNVRQNWEHLRTQDDIEDPEVIRKVISNGIPDVYMAQVIRKEFITPGEKGVVYTNAQHAFTDYTNTAYAEKALSQGLDDNRRTGNIIHDEIYERAATVLLHSPWPDSKAGTGLAYPANGIIDDLIKRLPEERTFLGFDIAGTPLGAQRIYTSSYIDGYPQITFADLCDGYIILGPMSAYVPVTAIEGFINSGNIDRALEQFPGPKEEEEISVADMNDFIAGSVNYYREIFKKF